MMFRIRATAFLTLAALLLAALPVFAGALPDYEIVEELDYQTRPLPGTDIRPVRHGIRVLVERGLSRQQVEELIWFIAVKEYTERDSKYDVITLWMYHDADENLADYSVAMLHYGRGVAEPKVQFKDSYFESFDESLTVKRLPLETRKEIFRQGGKVEERMAKFGITEDEDIRISAEGYEKNWKTPVE